MLPGPDQIVACPHCKGLGKYMSLMSGNTFGARVWTDGKQIAPMLPRPPAVVKCRHCGKCYWLADAEEVGTVGSGGDMKHQFEPTWLSAEWIQEPVEEEFYAAIEEGLAIGPKQERTLRILAWWRWNDAFREAPSAQALGSTTTIARRENLTNLADLLQDGDESDRIMKAEVLRELGEFESATRLLKTITSSDYGAVVRQLLSMCEDKDVCVRELIFTH